MNDLPQLVPNEPGQVSLALFDFDGTITTGDSFMAMIRSELGDMKVFWGIIRWLPSLLGYAVGFVTRTKLKTSVLNWAFGGMTRTEIQQMCDRFVRDELPRLVRADALQRLTEHRERGDHVIVVSASPEEWIKTWCIQHNVGCIASRLQYDDAHRFTGNLRGPNCHGVEKVRRIREEVSLDKYPVRYAYGDTKGDLPMLALAQHRGMKVFRSGKQLQLS